MRLSVRFAGQAMSRQPPELVVDQGQQLRRCVNTFSTMKAIFVMVQS
jgi:hypothetical protein